jgi:hypothetical protein
MRRFIYHTTRIIEVIADTEDDANKAVEAELHDGETIICSTEEPEE